MERKAQVDVPIGSKHLEGDLFIPEGANGVVLFAHGSGSSRHSPRNRFVAEVLNKGNLATLLIDLLTKEEGQQDVETAALRFDIGLLTERLEAVTKWLELDGRTKRMRIGYFGASTGAAAALCAAAAKQKSVQAVVLRGGRPDLAGSCLQSVKAPTLLIVGGCDFPVVELNEKALSALRCEKKLVIVPHATHLFQEEGALESVAKLALDWFLTHLRG
ncbi:MAG: dienelactone hydrolase family protein [Rhabdochlamydiaceae bacterium]|nr:dienelactone hydrolase family protein [Rhabdochlamydiaceae bacterium]